MDVGSHLSGSETLILAIITNAFLQCFDAVGWAAGRALFKISECWGAGVVICLERDANVLHMV